MGNRAHLLGKYARQGHQCYWCGKTNLKMPEECVGWDPDMITRDHLIPKRLGGSGLRNNVVAACAGCNSGRERYTDGKPRVRVKAICVPTEQNLRSMNSIVPAVGDEPTARFP